MNLKNILLTHKAARAAFLAIITSFITSTVLAAGLIGVSPGFPKIDAIDTLGTTTYDLGTTILNVNAKPNALTFNLGDPPAFIFDSLTVSASTKINISVDSLCDVLGGNPGGSDLEVIGDVYDASFVLIKGGVLLTGDIVDMGEFPTTATTSMYDFRFTNAGGVLVNDGDWPVGADIGVTLTSENSSFTGDCSNSFGGGAKAIIGPIDPEVSGNVCDINVAKTASPDVLGPFYSHYNFGADSDTDSDSGIDHDNSGDTDDSDSDSETDSADSDAGAPACGCKGRVKQLTLRYNKPFANIVEVRRKNGKVLFGPQVLQPGEEFTFAVKGKKIKFLINMEKVAMLKTSCKHPIGSGQTIGSDAALIVVSGTSKFRNGQPICPFPGTTCSADHEVTYTYDITNNGTDATNVVLFDDQLGVIGTTIASLPGAASAPANMISVQTTTCIFKDTINKAVAIGILGDGITACESNEAQETVTIDAGGCPIGGDSDSDSGIDTNNNSDTDDSDADSGAMDCDKDEKRSCFGSGNDTDSDSGFDHNMNGDSDDSDSDSGPLNCDSDDSDTGTVHGGGGHHSGKRHRKGWGWW